MYTPETQAKLALFRQKQADGTLSDAELQEAVDLLRQERKTAIISSARKRAVSRVATKSADDLLAELEGK